MATKKLENIGRPNRVRFVLLEAELSDNNFTELTNAITQALKPHPAPSSPRALTTTPRIPPTLQGDSEDVEVQHAQADLDFDEEPEIGKEPVQKTPRVRSKLPLPKYLHDLKLADSSGKSFKEFAQGRAPKSQVKRYLLVAYWLKEHGGSPTVTPDKAYTCYKTAGWPLGISDWDATFRAVVKRDLMRRIAPGEYAITPLGEDFFQKNED